MKITIILVLTALVLGCCAVLRPPEYDEAYSIFLTAGDARPAWPAGVFTAGSVRGLYGGQASPQEIARDLQAGDVHPPLYFWLLEYWRRAAGPGWLSARALSVILSVGTLLVLADVATLANIPVTAAMLITLLSYGFAYTGIVARGFALAQFLNLAGLALVFRASINNHKVSALAGGIALGAGAFTNYIASFSGFGVLAWLVLARARGRLLPFVLPGFTVFLLADLPFFLTQRHSRAAQFDGFSLPRALALLVKDFGAGLFGGLPLYAGKAGVLVALLLASVFATCLVCVARRRQAYTGLFALLAAAPSCGLLALGLVFHKTPIEIRYLAFGLPGLALLFAQALPRGLLLLLLGVEACGIIGLALAPATMQPQAIAALQSAGAEALVLLPFGNDGVGAPGPFIAASPDGLRILLLHSGTMPDLSHEPRIILANLRVDDASRAASAYAIEYFSHDKCFASGSTTPFTILFLNRCADQQHQRQ